MADNVKISDLLRGVSAGYPQTVGYMTVIPLVSDLVDERFTVPSKIQTATKDYGSLEVKNPLRDGIAILPFGSAILTKQSAQNHAVGHAIPIKSGSQVTDRTAACIQDSQGGTIRMGEHQLSILPWLLKEPMFQIRGEQKYSKLWPSIKQFNTTLGLADRGHLEVYLQHFKKELDQFIAEFEVVHRQVGAVILINGEVVGVERAPNYAYWKDVWTPLIRECYGSLVLQYRKKYGDSPPPPKTRKPLSKRPRMDLDALQDALEVAQSREAEAARNVVRNFVEDQFEVKNETIGSKVAGMKVQSLTNKQFKGQVVKDGEAVVYASLFTNAMWKKNQKWHEASEFKI